MSMKMGWRWYGEGNDPITLGDIKQIPGVESIVWALHSKMPGEIWEEDEIKAVVDQIHSYGFYRRGGGVCQRSRRHQDRSAQPRPADRKLQAVHPQPVQVRCEDHLLQLHAHL